MKPLVLYKKSKQNHIVIGQRAFIKPLNHPDKKNVSNVNFVLTSIVIHKTKKGFETLNTVYEEEK